MVVLCVGCMFKSLCWLATLFTVEEGSIEAVAEGTESDQSTSASEETLSRSLGEDATDFVDELSHGENVSVSVGVRMETESEIRSRLGFGCVWKKKMNDVTRWLAFCHKDLDAQSSLNPL